MVRQKNKNQSKVKPGKGGGQARMGDGGMEGW